MTAVFLGANYQNNIDAGSSRLSWTAIAWKLPAAILVIGFVIRTLQSRTWAVAAPDYNSAWIVSPRGKFYVCSYRFGSGIKCDDRTRE